MRWWIAALGLIACSGTPKPERLPRGPRKVAPPPAEPTRPPPPERLILDAPDPPTIDDRIRKHWKDLDLNGDNWRERVESIDAVDRPEMAMWLLQRGNFRCPLEETVGTCAAARPMRPVTSESGIYDACLRRKLALWAIDQLNDDQLYNLHDEMSALVAIPPPEEELTAKVLSRFQTGFEAASLRWEAKSSGHEKLPPFDVLKALDADDLRLAASMLHFDAAVLALDPADDLEIYIDAIYDEQLLQDTRLEVLDRLAELGKSADADTAEQIHYSLINRASSSNCIDAAAAVAALTKLDDSRMELPAGPFADPDTLIAATCATLGLGVRGKPWKHLLSATGIDVVNDREDPFRVDALWTQYPFAYDEDLDGVPDVPEADPDGDGDASNTRVTRTLRWNARFKLPYTDELRLALPHCEGVDCHIPDSSVWFHLDIARERGTKLRLRGIERHERIGSDC